MYCVKCGILNDDAANFCTKCGYAMPGRVAAPAVASSIYAGFWLRVGATLIDQLILTVAFFFGALFLGLGVVGVALGSPDRAAMGIPLVLVFWLIWILAPWLYSALLESGKRQATVGKMACEVKVTDLQGNRISFGRATGRYFAEWITGMTFFIGYLMVAFTEKRQSLHDMIAGTVVVRAGTEPAVVASAPPAKQMSGWAIAAICLAGMLPMIGILAAIAIPAYQDYTIRAQVTEGLVLAQEYKGEVESYVSENGEWPQDVATIGGDLASQYPVKRSRYVDSIEIWNGTIVITYGKSANQAISGLHLSLRPFLSADGVVDWQCGNGPLSDDSYESVEDSDGEMAESSVGVTSVTDKFLPASCRTENTESTRF